MKILIFHGYLLRGTGSNIYNANLAQALAGLGHDVHLLCQDLDAEKLDVGRAGSAPGTIDGLAVEELRPAGWTDRSRSTARRSGRSCRSTSRTRTKVSKRGPSRG